MSELAHSTTQSNSDASCKAITEPSYCGKKNAEVAKNQAIIEITSAAYPLLRD